MPTDRAPGRPHSTTPTRPGAPALGEPKACAWCEPWAPTLTLILLVMVGRLVYLAWFSPYALVEDEAHYWEWSRRLDWSYYSKGPGVAWAIALAGRVFSWVPGASAELAVRGLAPVFGALLSLGVAGLARSAFRDGRAGFYAALVTCLIPVFQALGLLMTIDGPFAACWALAAWFAWLGLTRGGFGWWSAFGLAVAWGFLFKYTAVLILPGVAVYAWLLRPRMARAGRVPGRGELGRSRFGGAVGVSIALLGLLPVAIWNAQHDWATVRHLLGHLGLPGSDLPPAQVESRSFVPNGLLLLEFLGLQLALVGPAVVLMIYSFARALRPRAGEPVPSADPVPGAWFALCTGLPVLLGYLVISPWVRVEGNWTLAGYVTLSSVAGWGVVRALDLRRARGRGSGIEHRLAAWRVTWVVGVIVGLGMLRVDLLTRVPGVGGLIPIGRVFSGVHMANGVRTELERMRESGANDPFVIVQHYGRASLLAFYLPGQPTVYGASSYLAGRTTQYDVFPETDLRRADVFERLRGRDAVGVGATGAQWLEGFRELEPLGKILGDHKRMETFRLYGYIGFPSAAHEPWDAHDAPGGEP